MLPPDLCIDPPPPTISPLLLHHSLALGNDAALGLLFSSPLNPLAGLNIPVFVAMQMHTELTGRGRKEK